MGWMFNESHKLQEINGFKKFNTSKVINMKAMFQRYNELKNLELSKFNTSNVIDMGRFFN